MSVQPHHPKRRRANLPLVFELLEDRTTPATFNVATLADLINAINTGNANGEADTINLNGADIEVTARDNSATGWNGLPVILADGGNAMTIDGGGGSLFRMAGSDTFRFFSIDVGATLNLADLEIEGGFAEGGDSNFGGAGAGLGGAILNRGTLGISGVLFVDNTANGGDIDGALTNVVGGGGLAGDGQADPGSSGADGGGPNGGSGGVATATDGGFGGGGGGTSTAGGSTGGDGGFGGGGGFGNGTAGDGGFGGGGGGTTVGTAGVGGFGAEDGTTVGGAGAGFGGAIFNLGGALTITNSTFSGNAAVGGTNPSASSGEGLGGAIFNLNGVATLTHVTFSGNTADSSGVSALYSLAYDGDDLKTENPGTGNGATTLTLTNVLLDSGQGILSVATSGNTTNDAPTSVFKKDDVGNQGTQDATIVLGALADNGGLSRTHALLAGDMVIDNATNQGSITTDQRGTGFVRNFNGSDVGAFEQQDATSMVDAPTTLVFGDPTQPMVVTIAATSGDPDGSVEFSEGGNVLGTVMLDGSNQASFTLDQLDVGMHTIDFEFISSNGLHSTTGSANVTVTQATSTTELTADVNPTVYGQSITLVATVAADSPSDPDLTGFTVEFFDDTTSLGTAMTNSSGVATLTVSSLSVGMHTLTATFDGDTNIQGSTSDPLTQTVNQASTSTTLVGVPNPVTAGNSVEYTATVTVQAPGANGNDLVGDLVEFFQEGNSLGTAMIADAGGGVFEATMSINFTIAGTQEISAMYLATTEFNSSLDEFDQTIDPAAASQLEFSQEPTNARVGQPFTVIVRALDEFGNLDVNYGDSVTVAIGTNPEGGTLGGTLSQNAVDGVATFDDLTIDASAEGYTLTADSSTFPQIETAPFDVGLALRGLAVTSGNLVKFYNADTGEFISSIVPFPGYSGEVSVALGDVDGDEFEDVIAAPASGGGPHVKVFSGADLSVIRSFFAYSRSFRGGVFVSSGDINDDGFADIITGAGAGGGPHVRVFSGADGSSLASFFAFNRAFKGGVRVASGDVTGDGVDDLVTAAAPGGGPHVRVFDLRFGLPNQVPGSIGSFFAYSQGFKGGVYVATGDVNGDGQADVITGPGAGGGPHIQVFSGANRATLHSFFAYGRSFRGGVRVGSTDVDSDGIEDVVTIPGPGGSPRVRSFSGVTGQQTSGLFGDFLAFSSSRTIGGFVAGGMTFVTTSPLRASSVGAGSVEPLTDSQLADVGLAALQAWQDAGLSQQQLDRLAATPIQITDLAGATLGLVTYQGVLIDRDGAGHGWHLGDGAVDPNRVDLLTALIHEYGHLLGFEDLAEDVHGDHLMSEELVPGERQLPWEDLVDDLFDDQQ